MDELQPSTTSNTLPKPNDITSSLTRQTVPESPDRSSGASFAILSQSPSEEFDRFELNSELERPTDENIQIFQELEFQTNVYKTDQKKLKEYGNLEKMYQETKTKLDQLQYTESSQSSSLGLDHNIHVTPQSRKDIVNPVSDVISLCETMCASLKHPEESNIQQLGHTLVDFTKQMMQRETQYTQQNKITDSLQSQVKKLQNDIDEKENQLMESRRQTLHSLSKASQVNVGDIEETSRGRMKNFSQQMDKQPVNDLIAEFKQLKEKYKFVKDENAQLQKANNHWDHHCRTIQEDHHSQMAAFRQKLGQSEDIIQSQRNKEQDLQQHIVQQKNENDHKLAEHEEQTNKAISFANSQAQKVDDLKKKLKMEQMKNEEQGSQIEHLNSSIGIHEEEIYRLQTEAKRLKETISRHESSSRSHGSLDLTLDDRNPHGNNQDNITQLKTEIEVLHQQVTIYKDDFEGERHDRERAQSELSTLRNQFSQTNDEIKAIHEESKKKTREIEALRASRDQDRRKLQTKDEEKMHLQSSVNHMVSEQSRLQSQVDMLQRQADYQAPPPYEYVSRQPSDTSGHSVQPQETENNASEWTCATCTFNNLEHKQHCDMCGHQRAQNRYSAPSDDLLPTYPGHASGYHGETLIDRTEQCDGELEWVRPACG